MDVEGSSHKRTLAALSALLLVLGLIGVAGAQGAPPRHLAQATPTPTPVYPIPTPTASPTPTPTPTATPTPFHQSPPPPAPAPGLMKPFPTVRTAGNFNRKRTQFTRVKITGPAGVKVQGRCTQVARKCRTSKTIPANRTIRLTRLERRFKPKTSVRILVFAPGVYGKYVAIKIRKGKPPVRRDRCLKPGTRKAVACPAS
jgi:hypothetical protein